MRSLVAALLLLAGGAVGKPITKVFVVWSNHLDIGYTDNTNGSCAGHVINRYFHDHFPRAIKTAAQSRAPGSPLGLTYKWMTHSWLVNAFRNCEATKVNVNFNGPTELICPNASAIAAFEAAVRRGDITWHAFPHNGEPEMYDASLFDAALNVTFREDEYFGHPHRMTLSQRDVPGLTRAAIPLLSRRGVKAVSVGENSQCAPLAVPPIFLWRDEPSNTEVVALFHAFGYGRRRRSENPASASGSDADDAATLARLLANRSRYFRDTNGDVIMTGKADPWDDGPGMHVRPDGTVDVNRAEHCVEMPEAGAAVCTAWKVDNSGPHTIEEATLLHDVIKVLFEGATITSSDAFDDFVEEVLPFKAALPVVTAELGDTWMMGANADPLKVAQYRQLSRAYRSCLEAGDCLDGAPPGPESEAALRTFERQLITLGEHTWGWNGGNVRTRSWTNKELQRSLRTDTDFSTSVLTWIEQRNFIKNAVAALPAGSKLAIAVAEALPALEPRGRRFDDTGYSDAAPSGPVACGEFAITFAADGSAEHIVSPKGTWATPEHTMFQLHYANPDHADIKQYSDDYVAGPSIVIPGIAAENLVKPNYNLPSLSSGYNLTRLRTHRGGGAVLLDLAVGNPAAHTDRGAPATAQALLECSGTEQVAYTLRLFNKTATHAPETVWLSNNPATAGLGLAPGAAPPVVIDKLGAPLNAADADLGCDGHRLTCGVHLHGVGDKGVCMAGQIAIRSVDSALVSIGVADPFPTPLRSPDTAGGVHHALSGNIWNTNYPFWYPFVAADASLQFRFAFTFGSPCIWDTPHSKPRTLLQNT